MDMEPLIISKTEDTPEIQFDPTTGHLVISERSWPENAIEFYKPIFDWLELYLQKPQAVTILEFKLEYFNTSSAKQIAKLLLLFEKNSGNTDITIRWHYEKDDIDMYTSGTRYAKLLNIKCEFIEH
jgi:hypothetical protein